MTSTSGPGLPGVAADAGDPAGSGPRSGSSQRTVLWVAVAVGVVLAVLIGVLATRQGGADDPASQVLGRPVPKVEGLVMNFGEPGEGGSQPASATFDIDELRGRWVVVNFFATWCQPCLVEHPELVRFSEEHGAVGDAVLVSIPFNDRPEAVSRFFAEHGGSWPVLDADAGAGRIGIDFGVRKLPETFLVSPEGIVVWKTNGGVTADQLDEAMAISSGAAPQGDDGSGAGSGGGTAG